MLALLAGSLTALCWAAEMTSATEPAESGVHIASAGGLLGMVVEDQDGERVGKVTDLVLNLRAGRVEAAMISPGAFWRLGPRRKRIPFGALSMATAKRNTLALAIASPALYGPGSEPDPFAATRTTQ